jgi:hypothetical protein
MTSEANNRQRPRLVWRVLEEGRRVLVIFFYLWALFSLFEFHKWMVLKDDGIISGQIFAIVNAFVFAKVLFLTERFGFAESFHDRPLIQPVLFKSAACTVVLLCFHFIEETGMGMLHGKNIEESIPSVGGGGLSGFVGVAIIMFIILIPFFAFRELSLAIGKDRMRELFFKMPNDRSAIAVGRAFPTTKQKQSL